MTPCPHCSNAGFTQLTKWLARDQVPVACSVCGQLAFVPNYRRSGIVLAALLLALVLGLVAVAAKSYVIALLGALGALSLYVWRIRAAPLERTWRAHSVAGAKVGFTASASALLLGLFQ